MDDGTTDYKPLILEHYRAIIELLSNRYCREIWLFQKKNNFLYESSTWELMLDLG